MAYYSKKAWMSPEARENEKYHVVMNSMRRLFPKSEVAKMDKTKWLAHRQAVVEAHTKQLERAVKIKEEVLSKGGQQPIPNRLKEKEFPENHGVVLCEKTIWCPKWQLKEEVAPWPTLPEMKWEGDDRAKTTVGRFLPLPREPGSAAVAWHNLRVLPAWPFDDVRKIPTLEDILLPVDEIDEDIVPDLLNSDLL
ncbi:uncharacterized protein BDZ99DRAFT_343968, partial [Mytilinidion resinicola]